MSKTKKDSIIGLSVKHVEAFMDRHESTTQQRQYLRRLKPYQRIQLAFELHDLARSRVAGEIKRRHPDLTKKELLEKLNERFIR